MNIVTGYRGTPHISANEAQALNQGIFGTGNYVLNVGNKFAATLESATSVAIQDGEGVIQGVQFRIAPGSVENVSISPGTSGYKRIDYICARYTKNASTGIEDVSLIVVEGTPSTSTPTAPTVNTGTILTGGSPVDFPLWEVDLDGLTPTLSSLVERVKTFAINPPDLTQFSYSQLSGYAELLNITESAWYAICTTSANGIVSINRYDATNQMYVPVVAGARMTPWIYIEAGTTGYKYAADVSTPLLYKAPQINLI